MNEFEWDPRKARSNLKKHGVSFAEALTIFSDQRLGFSAILIIRSTSLVRS